MEKFENVDIIRTLDEIMKTNTRYYASDFAYDKEELIRCAMEDHQPLLWMCRESGTYLFSERETLMQDSYAHNTWCFYGQNRYDSILAYAVEIKGVGTDAEKPAVTGNIYPLDYEQHWQFVQKHSVPVGRVICTFENGVTESLSPEDFNRKWYALTERNGKLAEKKTEPADEEKLDAVLLKLTQERKDAVQGNLEQHIALLKQKQAARYEQEALPKADFGMSMNM